MSYDSGDRDTGDYDSTEVVRSVANVWHPSFAPANIPTFNQPKTREELMRAREALENARRMLGQEADKEAVRAANWARLPVGIRRVAVMAANLPKERADDTLNKFDAFERGSINSCLEKVIRDLGNAQRAMAGGAMPKTEAVH